MAVTKEKKPASAKQLAARAAFAAAASARKGQPKAQQPFVANTPNLYGEAKPMQTAVQELAVYQQTQYTQSSKHMEPTVAEIKPYRPKKGHVEVDEDKMYEFELCTKREESRPLDKNAPHLPMGTGFQPSFSIPNRGSAFNKKTSKFENWRYIEGQPSCWVSEQPELEEYEPKDIDRLLGNPENDLEFRDGRMLVSGGETGKLRMQAMFLSDYFVDNEKPRIKRPSMYQFKLNNPDAVVEQGIDIGDLAYRTETQARNCTITEMLAVSSLMGINIEDTSPAGLNRIKFAFLNKAKYNPANPKAKEALEQFMEIINNPATKMKYLVNQGLFRGILSTMQHPGKLSWAAMEAPILELAGKVSVADEITARAIDKEKVVMELLAELENQINN